MPSSMPVIFAAHGAPILLDDAQWVGELHQWAGAMTRPSAILVVSAHWEERPVTIGATTPVPLVYDFYGFPEKYYQQRYATASYHDAQRDMPYWSDYLLERMVVTPSAGTAVAQTGSSPSVVRVKAQAVDKAGNPWPLIVKPPRTSFEIQM